MQFDVQAAVVHHCLDGSWTVTTVVDRDLLGHGMQDLARATDQRTTATLTTNWRPDVVTTTAATSTSR